MVSKLSRILSSSFAFHILSLSQTPPNSRDFSLDTYNTLPNHFYPAQRCHLCHTHLFFLSIFCILFGGFELFGRHFLWEFSGYLWYCKNRGSERERVVNTEQRSPFRERIWVCRSSGGDDDGHAHHAR
uniref:Uncharacterized protein n=1 Tax=Opuntia streptacantha TaxID=393608 RepID=A0A7C8ZGW6_OPUST